MGKKEHRLVEIKFRSMKDTPNFNEEYANKKGVIACDKAMVIIFKKENDFIKTELSSIDGDTLKQMNPEDLFKAWISFTAQLANMENMDNKHKVFLTHIGNLLKLKEMNMVAFPEGPNKPD